MTSEKNARGMGERISWWWWDRRVERGQRVCARKGHRFGSLPGFPDTPWCKRCGSVD